MRRFSAGGGRGADGLLKCERRFFLADFDDHDRLVPTVGGAAGEIVIIVFQVLFL